MFNCERKKKQWAKIFSCFWFRYWNNEFNIVTIFQTVSSYQFLQFQNSFYLCFSIFFNFNLQHFLLLSNKKSLFFSIDSIVCLPVDTTGWWYWRKRQKKVFFSFSCSATLQWNNKKESHTKKYLLDFISIDLCTLRLILKEEKRRWTVRKWNEMLHTQKSYVC